MGHTTRRVWPWAWAWIASALALGGCGDDIPDGTGTSGTTGAVTTGDATAGPTTTSGGSLDDTGTGTTTGGEDIDEFPGLSAPVEILIDDRGIPHIYGQVDLDVMYASGYQMATDRLFQMDLMRRRALGRQAEVLGPDFVGQDRISRIFDIPRWGAANVERLRSEEPEIYRRIVAWVAGVNARIAEVNAGEVPLPYGFGIVDPVKAISVAMGLEDQNLMSPIMLDVPFGELQLAKLASDGFSKVPVINSLFPPTPSVPDWSPIPPYAVTNAIFIDQDGNGRYDAPLPFPEFCSRPCDPSSAAPDQCPPNQTCLAEERVCGFPIPGRCDHRRLSVRHSE